MKRNKPKKTLPRLVEAITWVLLGACLTFTLMSDLAVMSKGIIATAIVLIMVVLFLLFGLSTTQSEEITPVYSGGGMGDGNRRSASGAANAAVQSAGGTDARISRKSSAQANPLDQKPMSAQKKEKRMRENKKISSIALINEEGDTLLEWSLGGKTAVIIGKSTEKEKVDVDLECSAYAQMISKQHAVLNYTEKGWCIDDIDSKNGTRVKKLDQNSIMDVKLVGAIEVEPGDIIYIANTMLLLR